MEDTEDKLEKTDVTELQILREHTDYLSVISVHKDTIFSASGDENIYLHRSDRFREKTVFICQIFPGKAKFIIVICTEITQVPHREAALRHAADPGEKQRGRPLPGTSVRHRPSSGARV